VSLLLLLAVGTAVRLTWWDYTFAADGVQLQPTDSHYYARFAQLQLRAFPRFDAWDAYVNAPEGANIIWPPLHTGLAALFAWLAGPGREEAGVAFVDLAAFCLDATLLWWLLRRRMALRPALLAVATVALVPITAFNTGIGGADHHVHEPYLAAGIAFLFAEALERRDARTAFLAGLLVGGARLLTTLGFLFLFPVAAALPLYALRHRSEPGNWGRLGLGLGLGAAVSLWGAAFLSGKPLSLTYVESSLFQPLTCLSASLAAAALAEAWTSRRRALPLLGAALLLALPLLGEFRHGLDDLLRKDALLATVQESQPAYRNPRWTAELLGPLGLSAVVLLPLVVRAATRSGSALAWVTVSGVAAWGACTALQARFLQPAAGPLALALALGVEHLLEGAPASRRRAAFAALGLLFVTTGLAARSDWDGERTEEQRLRPVMDFLRTQTPGPADPLDAHTPPAWTVVAGNDWGHLVTLWGQRAAVATPFSQAAVHVKGNARAAAVLTATDDETAYRLAVETKARYVLGTPSPVAGATSEQLQAGLVRRLMQHAGTREGEASGHFALVFDAPGGRGGGDARPFGRLFEVVPGAVLTGKATPGSTVRAELPLRTNTGEPLRAVHVTRADAAGRYAVRVAHATRPLGQVVPEGPWRVSHDGEERPVEVPPEAVREGRELQVP
jgi:dolichyl-diphosphooligosaccharide--protein glycosyltransferase